MRSRALASLLLLLLFLLSGCAPRVPRPLLGAQSKPLPEQHHAPTDDGWKLALWHYPAWFRTPLAARPDPSSPDFRARAPVILCHGLAANHYTWDLTEERSLARYLADRGYDVWMLDLRGHGESRRPKGRLEDPDGWGFDEYALRDVPAAVRYVRETTGASQVDWIGHSMGGMVIYAYLASSGDSAVRNVVTIGSPGSLDYANDLVRFSISNMKYVGFLPRVSSRFFARAQARLSGRIVGGYEETIWHLDNMAPDAARLMFWVGIADIERGVQRSFGSLMEAGGLVSRDRKTDYQAKLSGFRAPLLAIAGKLDGLAPPFVVQRIYERVGSTDKTYEHISRANGYSVDYGHVDLVMGDRAQLDVFPVVYRWLENRQGQPLTRASEAAAPEEGGAVPAKTVAAPAGELAPDSGQDVHHPVVEGVGHEEVP